MKFVHNMPFGAALQCDGGTRFALFAPAASRVELAIAGSRVAATEEKHGWWRLTIGDAPAGTHYHWIVDDVRVPDPASRCNPTGPHGESEVVDPARYEWRHAWAGRPWHETVVYEMHIGTFTKEGTFAAAARRLARLAELGITAIELMPIASAGQAFGWGYDGALWYAPTAAYGSPDDLKRLVDAAHGQGLMVFLDVVYNHFGPDGNFLSRYAPQFESPTHHTPWGRALNFDGEGAGIVREFVIQNALYWVTEFRIDGLRLDAVHAMIDESDVHIVEALTTRVRASAPGRLVHLILENDHNNPSRLGLPAKVCEGQWNGDFHHCLHVLMTGETRSYYAEYKHDPIAQLGRVLTLGFAREGAVEDRADRPRRRDATSTISLLNSVNFLQCHDQIGNRSFGERLNALAGAEAVRLASAMLLLSPPIPMLFMGEEHGSRVPFLYFADPPSQLREEVRAGRREEFRDAPDGERSGRDEPPDPCSRKTFEASVIEPPEMLDEAQRDTLAWTTELLALRRRELVPRLPQLLVGEHRFERIGASGLRVEWFFASGRSLAMTVNLGGEPVALGVVHEGLCNPAGDLLKTVGEVRDGTLGSWSGEWHWNAG